jgi:hypothetical protein
VTLLAFQMWEPMRQQWMAEHRFYVEQAKRRLLSQFDNIGVEADEASREYLKVISVRFDPDIDDPADVYESANDKEIEFYQLLSDMQERTRLGVIAGMYHEWDKKLRDWIVREVSVWHHGENAVKAIWSAEILAIFDLLRAFGFDARAVASYKRLDAMRLVVNVFKHGDGSSLDALKSLYPEFFHDPVAGISDSGVFWHFLDHTCMKVTDEQLDEFSEAILNFWTVVPKEIFLEQAEVHVPRWFEKACMKDEAAT